MNLHDIVSRRDPALVIERGDIHPAKGESQFVGVALSGGSIVRLDRLADFQSIREGRQLGWSVLSGEAEISIRDGSAHIRSQTDAIVKTGDWFDVRAALLPYQTGEGRIISGGPDGTSASIATGLADAADKFLDFIFVGQAFECFTSPLGALRTLSGRLAPGGCLLLAVPDCRYDADLRQAPTHPGEWELERVITDRAWVSDRTGLIPGAVRDDRLVPKQLRYTADTIVLLAEKAVQDGRFKSFEVFSSANSPNVGVRLVASGDQPKSSPAAALSRLAAAANEPLRATHATRSPALETAAARALILHIGAGKTGTSALQVAFARNAAQLRQLGVLYPEDSTFERAKSGRVTSGNGLAMALFLNPQLAVGPQPEHPIVQILDTLQQSEIRTILLSSEKMATFDPSRLELLARLCEGMGYALKVAFYVRNVIDHAFAMYVQRVRSGYGESFKSYLREWAPVCRRPIENVRDALGVDGLLVRHYDACKDDLLGDFASAVLGFGDEGAHSLERPDIVNRSLTRLEVQVLREFTVRLKDRKRALLLSNAFLEAASPNDNRRLTIWSDEIGDLEKRCQDEIDFVSRFLPQPLKLLSDDAQVLPGSEPPLDKGLRHLITATFALDALRDAYSQK